MGVCHWLALRTRHGAAALLNVLTELGAESRGGDNRAQTVVGGRGLEPLTSSV